MNARNITLLLLVLIMTALLSGCDYLDIGQLWARYDWCASVNPDTATGTCALWYDLGNGGESEQQATNAIRATATSLAQPTIAPTPIPPPPHRPVRVILPTETPVTGYSPLPTPTTTPVGGDWVPDIDNYEGLLDWYFDQ